MTPRAGAAASPSLGPPRWTAPASGSAARRARHGRAPNEPGASGAGGPHFCLGAHLARREVGATFVELFRRLPDIEATAEPERLRSHVIRGIERRPVAFTPA
jgi:cytochrome P450